MKHTRCRVRAITFVPASTYADMALAVCCAVVVWGDCGCQTQRHLSWCNTVSVLHGGKEVGIEVPGLQVSAVRRECGQRSGPFDEPVQSDRRPCFPRRRGLQKTGRGESHSHADLCSHRSRRAWLQVKPKAGFWERRSCSRAHKASRVTCYVVPK